jgi:DNA-binding response OmpR family regulator
MAPSLSPARRKPRLLVVTPNKGHLSLLARRLGEEGYALATAADGPGALGELHRNGVDLVLAELVMAPMSGPELTRAIREHGAFAHVPIMLLAGRAEPDPAVRAYAAGADDVMLKPFHFELLVARIERRLAAARQLASLQADMVALDARAALKAIELGELRDRMYALEAERRRLAAA